MIVGYLSVATHPREARLARVRVDDVDVTRGCIAADDVAGFAECYVRDAAGRYVINPEGTGLLRQRLYGRVEIDFPHGLD